MCTWTPYVTFRNCVPTKLEIASESHNNLNEILKAAVSSFDKIRPIHSLRTGWDSATGIATCCMLDDAGIDSRRRDGGEIFCTRQDGPWGLTSLLHNRHRVTFPGVKRPELGVNHPLPCGAEAKERVQLYLYNPNGLSRSVLWCTFISIHASVCITTAHSIFQNMFPTQCELELLFFNLQYLSLP